MTAKEQILKAMSELPDDASIEEAMDHLYLLYKIERGIRQADAHQKITQEEAKARMGKWLP